MVFRAGTPRSSHTTAVHSHWLTWRITCPRKGRPLAAAAPRPVLPMTRPVKSQCFRERSASPPWGSPSCSTWGSRQVPEPPLASSHARPAPGRRFHQGRRTLAPGASPSAFRRPELEVYHVPEAVLLHSGSALCGQWPEQLQNGGFHPDGQLWDSGGDCHPAHLPG